MTKELEMAARIQQSLLPPAGFSAPGVSLSWIFKPCDELAGDTLNVIRLDKNHLGLYIIDVSGHGVSSSLLSFTLSRWMSAQPDHSGLFSREDGSQKRHHIVSPAQVAEQLNQRFPMDLQTNQYFTFFYGILNLKTGLFRYVNAGHPPPVYLAAESEPTELPASGLPIGLLREARYEEHTITVGTKDRLVLYTDGLVEAFNPREEEYGSRRLLENIVETRGLPLNDSLEILAKSVEEWHGSERQRDDLSLLAFEFQP
jgi:sigma-B regulation protein RsbU (phosphoserine phosphatase)